jgi:hypothetical protein
MHRTDLIDEQYYVCNRAPAALSRSLSRQREGVRGVFKLRQFSRQYLRSFMREKGTSR